MPSNIQTRILILSDTHGKPFHSLHKLPACDVVIHCGDLTDGSRLDEFRTTLQDLITIEAPLKLVIAGNHDFTMDIPAFNSKVTDAEQPLDPDLVVREYGSPGEARQLFVEAKEKGVVFLDEGTHQFKLDNGALLSVYASPYTPSMGQWGFPYHPNKGRDFKIGDDIDIAITHGPPKGIMDYTSGRERAGCPDLFTAIATAKPRIHCFGHIHEGWGARLVTWKEGIDQPTHFTAINNDKSTVVENLAGLREGKYDSPEDIVQKQKKRAQLEKNGYLRTSHCSGDQNAIERDKQTLFVNAAIESSEEFEQRPWLVDIDLPAAIYMENASEVITKAEAPTQCGKSLRKVQGQVDRIQKVNKSKGKTSDTKRSQRWLEAILK